MVLVELAGVGGATPPIPAKKFTLLGVLHSVWELIQCWVVLLFLLLFLVFVVVVVGVVFFSCLFVCIHYRFGGRKEQEYLLPGNYCNWAHEK